MRMASQSELNLNLGDSKNTLRGALCQLWVYYKLRTL